MSSTVKRSIDAIRRKDAGSPGGVVHAFSTYESRHKAEDATPFVRGINSIQLFNDGQRWWVVTVFWEGERPNNPIPEKYLTSQPPRQRDRAVKAPARVGRRDRGSLR